MFKKLRNRLILINLGVTSVVVLIVFASIYFTTTRSADLRAPMFEMTQPQEDEARVPEEMEDIVAASVKEEKAAAARQLLITLVVSWLTIELTVAAISYFMAEEAIKPVRDAYEAQKVFIANASHEIKTPLAAIAANLEAADIQNNKWIKNIETETAKLTVLNTSLLTLARTDLKNTVTVQETDLVKLADENIKSFVPRLKNLKLTQKITIDEKIKINREDFAQILSVLLDNAVKYGHKKILVELNPHELVVENDGKTIPPEQLPHIFERFYQVDKSAEGVGLGLSIAKSLADRNKWQLLATSENGTTRFTLNF